ncbi:MAG: cytochrome c [Burkholderiaceae bacterium]|nr:cytochrome c [Burkholderiaceae bacterium]
MNGKFRIIAASTLLASLSLGAYAQSSAERSIQYRQGVMKAQSWHLGNMAAQVKGDKPYKKDQIKVAFGAAAKTCKTCHDEFRPR